MKKQIVVIGLGRLGENIAKTLITIGHEVLAIDYNEALVQAISPFVTHAVQIDSTNEATLKELGLSNFDIAVITLSEIENSVLATMILKKLGVPFIIARAISEQHGMILERIGANKVVFPEREMGSGIAYTLTLGNVIDYIPVTTTYGVVKMSVSADFVGKSLLEIGFGRGGKLGVVVLLLQHKQDIIVNPSTSEQIKQGDMLVVSGHWDKLEELTSKIQKSDKSESNK